jgi:hypothetical protein
MTKAAKQPAARFEPDEATSHAMRHFSYLYGRWQDEQGYEDFNEYRKSARANLPPGSTAPRMTNKPFRIEYQHGGYSYRMTATEGQVHVQRGPLPGARTQ